MRDSQRQRVYDSEYAIDHGERFETLADCQAFVDRVLQRKRLATKFPGKNPHRMTITCKDGRGRRMAFATTTWAEGRVVKLPLWARTELTILHEMTHHFSPALSQHDWVFCSNLLTLVREVMGVEAYRALKGQYDTRKVRYKAPRTRQMTPEQRQAAAERLAAVRASREALKGIYAVRANRDGEERWIMQISEKFGRLHVASTPYREAAKTWAYEATASKWAAAIAKQEWKDYSAEVVDLAAC